MCNALKTINEAKDLKQRPEEVVELVDKPRGMFGNLNGGSDGSRIKANKVCLYKVESDSIEDARQYADLHSGDYLCAFK